MGRSILSVVKLATEEYLNTRQLTDLRIGTIVDTNPIKIKISNQLTIPSSAIIVPQHLTDYKVKTNNGDLTIFNSLKVNDKVALLKKQGGQSYFILDRI